MTQRSKLPRALTQEIEWAILSTLCKCLR